MDKAKILIEAQERFKHVQEWESSARAKFRFDVKFALGDSENLWQWPEAMAQTRLRADRPCLTVNKVKVFCNQIINDARQHKAAIAIKPTGGGASYKSAEILQGIIQHIESHSNAAQAYDSASWSQVMGGIGWWRVTTDYADDDSFDQEIKIQRVADALSIFLDPDIQEFDGSDARYGFVFRDIPRDQFEKEYPKYKDLVNDAPLDGSDGSGWNNEHKVRVAEYYRRIEEPDKLHFLDNGSTIRESEVKDANLLDQLNVNSVRTRDIARPKVEWYLIAGSTIVEKEEWPGDTIPLVRCVGEETVIDGVLDRRSHVRSMLDAQRLYNFYTSAGAEFVALQSKTPYVAPVQAIEGYTDEWAQANTENLAVLPYNSVNDQGQAIPPPQRQQPPVFAAAYLEGTKLAAQEMMMASGQHESSLGEPSNERSGTAIQQRQRQGENAVYHFIDHQASAIRYTGRILVDLIPKIYDTQRVIKILQPDGTQQTIQIDPNAPQAQMLAPPVDDDGFNPQSISAIFNPSLGSYSVTADVGPQFATRRQAAFNAMADILAQNESLTAVIGDLMFKSADFPLSDQIAERLRNMVPDKALGKAGPDPQVMQLQQMLAQQHQVIQQMTEELKASKDKSEIAQYDSETKRLAAIGDVDPMLVQLIARQLWENMSATSIVDPLKSHAALEQSLMPPQPGMAPPGQQGMAPPTDPNFPTQ